MLRINNPGPQIEHVHNWREAIGDLRKEYDKHLESTGVSVDILEKITKANIEHINSLTEVIMRFGESVRELKIGFENERQKHDARYNEVLETYNEVLKVLDNTKQTLNQLDNHWWVRFGKALRIVK